MRKGSLIQRIGGDKSWVPVKQPGGIYCSPRCGFKCKRTDYDRAVRDSNILARRMGLGWEARVWENCAWHYEVSKGAASIHATIDRSKGRPWKLRGYVCYFNSIRQTVSDHAKTPEAALKQAMKMADDIVVGLINDLAILR